MEFMDFLPTLVTVCIIGPAGFYVKNRAKNLATKHDFSTAVDQLKKSTDAVESVKNQLSEKYWVKQQIWETKRAAYEEILECLHLTKKYVDAQVLYMDDYLYSFIHIGSGGYGYGDESEEYHQSHAQYVKEEQDAFNRKYHSETEIQASKELSNNTKESFANLENVFSIKSLYLDPELKVIETLLSNLKTKLYDESPSQGDEDLGEFLESSVEHHKACGELVNEIITTTRKLAREDLKL